MQLRLQDRTAFGVIVTVFVAGKQIPKHHAVHQQVSQEERTLSFDKVRAAEGAPYHTLANGVAVGMSQSEQIDRLCRLLG